MKTAIRFTSMFMILFSCSSSKMPADETPVVLTSNQGGQGVELEIEMTRGKGHNHPLMAIWVENTANDFIQTLYVAESIGRGVFRHGDSSMGFWKPGEIQRPAALPRWSHSRGIMNEMGYYLPTPTDPVADAYTGPTPDRSFILQTRIDERGLNQFRVLFEINQTWDWNEYWTNNKYPEDEQYKSSCQPALVYATTIDLENPREEYVMELIGRSHHSGSNGALFTDLQTMTTALHIAEKIVVRIPGQ